VRGFRGAPRTGTETGDFGRVGRGRKRVGSAGRPEGTRPGPAGQTVQLPSLLPLRFDSHRISDSSPHRRFPECAYIECNRSASVGASLSGVSGRRISDSSPHRRFPERAYIECNRSASVGASLSGVSGRRISDSSPHRRFPERAYIECHRSASVGASLSGVSGRRISDSSPHRRFPERTYIECLCTARVHASLSGVSGRDRTAFALVSDTRLVRNRVRARVGHSLGQEPRSRSCRTLAWSGTAFALVSDTRLVSNRSLRTVGKEVVSS